MNYETAKVCLALTRYISSLNPEAERQVPGGSSLGIPPKYSPVEILNLTLRFLS